MVTDPIADMLTRIRNAIMARHDNVVIPLSKAKVALAKILKDEGFITDYAIMKGETHRYLKVTLRYVDNKSLIMGLERVSKPGLRLYVKRGEIPRVYGGMGIAILSTSKGIMVGKEAWRRSLGGELLCYVW
ncbi:MAG: 30S ribosomal protein S8 [Chloroflexi bacterium RBG_16_48_7]|nr:MAG: 30S ribosomal protein S8 [Chloroflexi bacterium RBG_16_48_7]